MLFDYKNSRIQIQTPNFFYKDLTIKTRNKKYSLPLKLLLSLYSRQAIVFSSSILLLSARKKHPIVRNINKLITWLVFLVKYFGGWKVGSLGAIHPSIAQAIQIKGIMVCFKIGYQEIKKHLPILLKTIPLISKAYKNTQFVCITPSKKSSTIAQKILSSQKLKIPLICEDAYNLIGNSDLALTASGTVTLETAILKTPMIIFYKINFLSYLLFRYIFNVQIIGLPNIVMKEKFVPELLSNSLTPEKIAQKSIEILEKKAVFEKMKKKFSHLKNKLGTKGAYKNTAKYLHKQFKQFHKT